MSVTITVIDYGVGNVQSIMNSLNASDVNVQLSADADIIAASDAIILPGVGAFKKAMEELKKRNLNSILKEYVSSGKPLLGICLGMQLLFNESEEFGITEGLGLIEGKVTKFPSHTTGKLPHISWNSLSKPASANWDNTILQATLSNNNFYFVHSFICTPEDQQNVLSTTVYGGVTFCSSVKKDNIIGCQYHPEKSAQDGLQVLKQFINLAGCRNE